MTPSLGSSKMFHTFQGLAPPRPTAEQSQETPKPATNGISKRITTPHACAECKRRKIRCDGRQPCGQCLGCRSPKPCYYDKHRQRVIPSRKTLDALSQSLEECRVVLKKLYPNHDSQALLPLSRQDLIALLDRDRYAPQNGSLISTTSPTGSNTTTSPLSNFSQDLQSPIASTSDEDRALANLEQIPSQDTEWDEERRNRDPMPAEADDVNALSLAVDRQSSYLGASSIKAAFLVMLKVAPKLRSFLAPTQNGKQNNVASNYPTPRLGGPAKTPVAITWSSEGQTLIDAYFNRVQMFVPMLDEPSFRADYLNGRRCDGPWLALLNMVFAMGSIVATKSDEHTHLNYYNQARDHLTIDSFGSGHLESLQAFTIMGGFYLHYINRPNMANAVTGAALRMACAMGLHRESPPEQSSAGALNAEQRRRTWWSLFCLDTWASTTLGRPSMGRWGPGITIRSPEESNDMKVMGQHAGIAPMIENIKFCKISTQIQDTLAHSPLLHAAQRNDLDRELTNWHENLPWMLRSTEPCPESIYTTRCIMKWRYQNLRIVLHRPVLLNLANSGDEARATQDESEAINKVRMIAKETIQDIAREWTPNQMLGWNGVWFMYQASMIPLVSMFWESWNTALVRDCQQQIEIVLEAFEGMADWSLAARRSREVLLKMYEASKSTITQLNSPRPGPIKGEIKGEVGIHGSVMTPPSPMNGMNSMHDGMSHIMNGMSQMNGHMMDGPDMQHMEMMGDDGMVMIDHHGVWDLDGMLWGNLPDGLDMPFDGMPVDFEDGGMQHYDGNYMMMHQ
ncbi:fungal-specific transcription factor domain-containing protein [Amylocarpus encephaloides]|uniref:Fungal-specific transcription factor domain-containing protein n=1 Tax=Amylocarpus encephaloides TaxID=45428 RepID=A0A9P7Y8K7_9HELO|nr:fungal-specific transcription factor domain-containing protein [Amylocarpus encephaloides]